MEEQIILVLNKYEFGLIVNALNELRTDLQKENKDREPVNELLLRLLNTPVKKKSIFKSMANKCRKNNIVFVRLRYTRKYR